MNYYDKQLDRYNLTRRALISTLIVGVFGGEALIAVGYIISNPTMDTIGAISVVTTGSSFILAACLTSKPIPPQFPESF